MHKGLSQRLFKKYFLLISMVFTLFIFVVMWSLKFSYNQAIEHTLIDMTDKIEKQITVSYFSGNKKLLSQRFESPFLVYLYEYIDGKYKLIVKSTVLNVVSSSRLFPEGFHVEELSTQHGQQDYAEYDKTFEVYHHKYHILVLRNLYTFFDIQKIFFIWIFLLGGLMYIFVLLFGYRYITKLIEPIHKMIETTSSISSTNVNKRLILPTIKDEFYTLSETINSMLSHLDKSLMKTKRFNAKVSHELRTPLTIIRGEIEVGLYKERTKEEYKEILYSTLEEVDTLQSITDNMLLLTKLDFKTVHIKKLHVRLDKVVGEAIASCRMQFESKMICIESVLVKVMYLMEETLIRQSIKNLINNAIKYSPSESLIKVVLKKEGEKIILEIEDEGYGISEKDLKYIFEPYYRSNNNELEQISGEGLGLTIVHHSLMIHNASLNVTSILGKGSCFSITF